MASPRREGEGSRFRGFGRWEKSLCHSVCAVFIAGFTVSSLLATQVPAQPATSQDSQLSASAQRGIAYAALVARGRT